MSGAPFTPQGCKSGTKTGVVFTAGMKMQQIAIFGDELVEIGPQESHPRKINDGNRRVQHRHGKTNPAKNIEAAVLGPIRLDQMQFTFGDFES